MFVETLAVFERLAAVAVRDGRSFSGGFGLGGEEEHHGHSQTCEHRFDEFGWAHC